MADDQGWADGPSTNAASETTAAAGNWDRGEANGRRSASPAARGGGGGGDGGGRERERERERERSPMRGVERGRGGGGGGGDSNTGSNLHVSGISNGVTDDDLRQHFAQYGRIKKANVMRDPHTQDVRGFGFVDFESSADADAAVEGANGTELMGKMLSVQKARRGRARTPTPGQYHGPPKERDFPPRGGGGYGGGGYGDDRYSRGPPSRYDDRDSYRRDDRDRYGGGGGSRYDDYGSRGGGGGRYEESSSRRYDDHYDRRPPPPTRDYDDRGDDRRRY